MSVGGFAVILGGALYVVFMASYTCHQQPTTAKSYVCFLSSTDYQMLRSLLLLFAPALASAVAVMAAPSHKVPVGVLTVLAPAVMEAAIFWSHISGPISPISDVLPIITLTVPSLITTTILVFILERRRVA
jgi:uncharacterized membrane protein YecN with MAPEG domain